MNCKNFNMSADRLIDGYLSLQDKATVLEHMANCSRCSQEYKSLTQIQNAIKQHNEHIALNDNMVLSPDFDQRFWARLERETEKKPVWQPVWRPSFALAAVFVAFFFLTHSMLTTLKTKNSQQNPVLDTESLIDTSLQLLRQEGECRIAEERAKSLLNQIM